MRVQAKPRTSRLAVWARRAALLAVLLLGAAIVGFRAGLISEGPALGLIAAGLACSAAAVIAALFAFAAIWRHAVKGFGPALIGFALGLALLAYPAVLGVGLFSLPAIADVSTDPSDLIAFQTVAHAAPGPSAVAAQRQAYPEVAPHAYAADPAHAFEEVLALVEARGWEIVRVEPPVVDAPPAPGPEIVFGAAGGPVEAPLVEPAAPEVAPGYVEAVARTLIVGFPEDVVIRVSAGPTGAAIVDMRSASRVFQHDFGGNARRVGAFLADLDARLPAVPN